MDLKLNRKFFFKLLLFLFLSVSQIGFCISPSYGTQGKLPWFTGPLVTPSGRVVQKGHGNIEPYFYYTIFPGKYDKNWKIVSAPKFYEITLQVPYKLGILDGVNLSGVVQGFYNWSRGQSAFAFGDLPLGLDFEVIKGTEWFAKFSVQEVFPTGKYERLNPKKFGTQAGGFGSYVTSFGFTLANLQQFGKENFLSTRLNLVVFIPSRVRVSGLSVYGGDPTTHGVVHPGNMFTIFAGAEYSLTKNWVLAMDLGALYGAKTPFRGRTILPVGDNSFAQLSAAPAVEYNWNEEIGLIVGSWFTFAGRNASRFVNFVAALNWNF